MICASWSSPVFAQGAGSADITGLEHGERDTMRLDYRMGGSEERDHEARLRDDKIRPDEMRVRRELREEEELLRAQEETQQQRLRSRRADESRAESRRRIQEHIDDKKRDFEFETSIQD